MEPVQKSRVEIINDYLTQYPIEEHLDWYKLNLPDVYAGYVHGKTIKKVKPENIKTKAKVSLKLLGILAAILIVFGIIVYFVVMNFLGQGMSLFQ